MLDSKNRNPIIKVERLAFHMSCIPALSRWHFEQWGTLTGSNTVEEYARFLEKGTTRNALPIILVAMKDDTLAGSATLLQCDMKIRDHLSPWLGQLFVAPECRKNGIGSTLVRAAAAEARMTGYARLYLYTSGTLPLFYEGLGWGVLERVHYLGKERSVLHYDLEEK